MSDPINTSIPVLSTHVESGEWISNSQLTLSSSLKNFCKQAFDGYFLAGMTMGRAAGIVMKCESFSLFSKFFGNSFTTRTLAGGIGLAMEGTLFHIAPQVLETGKFIQEGAFLGSLNSSLTILACQIAMRGAPPNRVMREVTMNCSIMSMEAVTQFVGISDQPIHHTSAFEWYLSSQLASFRVQMGTHFVQGGLPHISRRETRRLLGHEIDKGGVRREERGIRNIGWRERAKEFFRIPNSLLTGRLATEGPEGEFNSAIGAKEEARGFQMTGSGEGEKPSGSISTAPASEAERETTAAAEPISLKYSDKLAVMIPTSFEIGSAELMILDPAVRTPEGTFEIDSTTSELTVKRTVSPDSVRPLGETDSPIYARSGYVLIAVGSNFSTSSFPTYLHRAGEGGIVKYAYLERREFESWMAQTTALLCFTAENNLVRSQQQLKVGPATHPLSKAREAIEMTESISDPLDPRRRLLNHYLESLEAGEKISDSIIIPESPLHLSWLPDFEHPWIKSLTFSPPSRVQSNPRVPNQVTFQFNESARGYTFRGADVRYPVSPGAALSIGARFLGLISPLAPFAHLTIELFEPTSLLVEEPLLMSRSDPKLPKEIQAALEIWGTYGETINSSPKWLARISWKNMSEEIPSETTIGKEILANPTPKESYQGPVYFTSYRPESTPRQTKKWIRGVGIIYKGETTEIETTWALINLTGENLSPLDAALDTAAELFASIEANSRESARVTETDLIRADKFRPIKNLTVQAGKTPPPSSELLVVAKLDGSTAVAEAMDRDGILFYRITAEYGENVSNVSAVEEPGAQRESTGKEEALPTFTWGEPEVLVPHRRLLLSRNLLEILPLHVRVEDRCFEIERIEADFPQATKPPLTSVEAVQMIVLQDATGANVRAERGKMVLAVREKVLAALDKAGIRETSSTLQPNWQTMGEINYAYLTPAQIQEWSNQAGLVLLNRAEILIHFSLQQTHSNPLTSLQIMESLGMAELFDAGNGNYRQRWLKQVYRALDSEIALDGPLPFFPKRPSELATLPLDYPAPFNRSPFMTLERSNNEKRAQLSFTDAARGIGNFAQQAGVVSAHEGIVLATLAECLGIGKFFPTNASLTVDFTSSTVPLEMPVEIRPQTAEPHTVQLIERDEHAILKRKLLATAVWRFEEGSLDNYSSAGNDLVNNPLTSSVDKKTTFFAFNNQRGLNGLGYSYDSQGVRKVWTYLNLGSTEKVGLFQSLTIGAIDVATLMELAITGELRQIRTAQMQSGNHLLPNTHLAHLTTLHADQLIVVATRPSSSEEPIIVDVVNRVGDLHLRYTVGFRKGSVGKLTEASIEQHLPKLRGDPLPMDIAGVYADVWEKATGIRPNEAHLAEMMITPGADVTGPLIHLGGFSTAKVTESIPSILEGALEVASYATGTYELTANELIAKPNPIAAIAYGVVTQNVHEVAAGVLPVAMAAFSLAVPTAFTALKDGNHIKMQTAEEIIEAGGKVSADMVLPLHVELRGKYSPIPLERAQAGVKIVLTKEVKKGGRLIYLSHTAKVEDVPISTFTSLITPAKDATVIQEVRLNEAESADAIPITNISSFKVTSEHPVQFRRISGDHNILHGIDVPEGSNIPSNVAAVAAKFSDSPFHGMGTFSYMIGALYSAYRSLSPLEPIEIARARFTRYAVAGDILTPFASKETLAQEAEGRVKNYAITLLNQKGLVVGTLVVRKIEARDEGGSRRDRSLAERLLTQTVVGSPSVMTRRLGETIVSTGRGEEGEPVTKSPLTGNQIYELLIREHPEILSEHDGKDIVIHPPTGEYAIGVGIEPYDRLAHIVGSDHTSKFFSRRIGELTRLGFRASLEILGKDMFANPASQRTFSWTKDQLFVAVPREPWPWILPEQIGIFPVRVCETETNRFFEVDPHAASAEVKGEFLNPTEVEGIVFLLDQTGGSVRAQQGKELFALGRKFSEALTDAIPHILPYASDRAAQIAKFFSSFRDVEGTRYTYLTPQEISAWRRQAAQAFLYSAEGLIRWGCHEIHHSPDYIIGKDKQILGWESFEWAKIADPDIVHTPYFQSLQDIAERLKQGIRVSSLFSISRESSQREESAAPRDTLEEELSRGIEILAEDFEWAKIADPNIVHTPAPRDTLESQLVRGVETLAADQRAADETESRRVLADQIEQALAEKPHLPPGAIARAFRDPSEVRMGIGELPESTPPPTFPLQPTAGTPTTPGLMSIPELVASWKGEAEAPAIEPAPSITGGEPAARRGKIAFLYPGQGSEHVGMGRLFFEMPIYRDIMKAAERGAPGITKLMLEGPSDILTKPENAQPALTAMAIGISGSLCGRGVYPDLAAGYDCGFYSAFVSTISFQESSAVSFARFRGRLMSERVPSNRREIMIIEQGEAYKASIQEICEGVSQITGKIVEVFEYQDNSTGKGRRLLAISGEIEAVQEVIQTIKIGKFLFPLVSPLEISPIKEAFSSPSDPAKNLVIPFVSSLDGKIMRTYGQAEKLLFDQMVREDKIGQPLDTLLKAGVTTFIHIGPGLIHPLAKDMLLRKGLSYFPTLTPLDLEAIVAHIQKMGALHTRGDPRIIALQEQGRAAFRNIRTLVEQMETVVQGEAPKGEEVGAELTTVASLSQEIATYERYLSTLLAYNAGRHVVIKGDRIIGIHDTREKALELGYKQFGNTPFLAREILKEQPVLQMTSPYTALDTAPTKLTGPQLAAAIETAETIGYKLLVLRDQVLTPQIEGTPSVGVVSLAHFDSIPTSIEGIIGRLDSVSAESKPIKIFDAVDIDIAAGIARVKEGLLEAADLFDEVRHSIQTGTNKIWDPIVALGPNGGILKRLLEQMIIGGNKNIVFWYYSNERAIKDNAETLAKPIDESLRTKKPLSYSKLILAHQMSEGRMNVAKSELENLYALIELCKIMGVRASAVNASGFIIDAERNIPEAERANALPLPPEVIELVRKLSPIEIKGLEDERILPLPPELISVVNDANAFAEAITGESAHVRRLNGSTGSKDMNAGSSAPEAVAAIAMTEEGPRIEIHPVKRQDPDNMLVTLRLMGYLNDALYLRFLEQGWTGERSEDISFTWSQIQRRKLVRYFPKYGDPDATLAIAKSILEQLAELRQQQSQAVKGKQGNIFILAYPIVRTASSEIIDKILLETVGGAMPPPVPPSRLGARATIKIGSRKRDPLDTLSLVRVDDVELLGLDYAVEQLRILNEGAMALKAEKYPDHDLKKPLLFTVQESAPTLESMRLAKTRILG